jgi:hypothetical protein
MITSQVCVDHPDQQQGAFLALLRGDLTDGRTMVRSRRTRVAASGASRQEASHQAECDSDKEFCVHLKS